MHKDVHFEPEKYKNWQKIKKIYHNNVVILRKGNKNKNSNKKNDDKANYETLRIKGGDQQTREEQEDKVIRLEIKQVANNTIIPFSNVIESGQLKMI